MSSNALVLTPIQGEPRIHDLLLAERLGFARPVKIRDLIKRNIKKLESFGTLPTVGKVTITGHPYVEFYPNQKQSLFLCMKSETDNAFDVQADIIRVYDAYLTRGQAALPLSTPALPDATITPAQQGILYQLALSRAGDRTIRAAVWARFSKHFSLNSYKNLPSSRFDEAVAYLESLQIEAKRKAIAAPADHQAALQQIKAAVAVLEVVPAAPAVIVKPGPAPVVRKQEPRTLQELSFVSVDNNGKVTAWAVQHDYAEEIWNDGVELGHDYAEEVKALAKHNEGEAYKALFLTLSGRKMGASGGPWGPVPGNETWIAGRGQEDGFADAIASLAVIGLRTLREMPEPTDRLHNPMFRLHGRK